MHVLGSLPPTGRKRFLSFPTSQLPYSKLLCFHNDRALLELCHPT